MKDSKWSSRKLSVTIGIEILTTFLLWVDKVPATAWENVTMAVVVGFCFSQAAVDRAKAQNYDSFDDEIRRG